MNGRDDDDIQGAEDRLLASMLGEVLGGTTPPDLSAAVVARLRRERVAPRRHAFFGRRAALGLGALVGAAAAWLLWAAPEWLPDRSETPTVPLRVVAGCLRWEHAATRVTAAAPASVAWPLAPLDRLVVCADSGAVTDLADLGRLHMDPTTELEVRHMEWKPFVTGAVLGAVTVAVIHGAITWTSGSDVARASTGDSIELRGGAPAAAQTMAALNARVGELEKELQEERRRYLALEMASGRKPVTADPTASPAPPTEEEKVAALRHAITYGGFETALDAIDWNATGEAMFKMSSQLEALVKAMKEGDDVPLAAVGEIQRLNAELIKQAEAIQKAKVPGTGINGAFTHPVIAANQIFAALEKGGMPLSDAQRDGLQRLSALIAGEDEVRRSKLGAEAIGLESLVSEMEIKDRFYAEARRLLTPQQEQALYQPTVDGTTSSLFSTGIAWAQFGKPVEAADRADYAAQVSDTLVRQVGLGDDASPQLRAMVETWAKSVPDAAFSKGGGDPRLAAIGQSTAAVREAARRQVDLYREMLKTLPLTAEQKAKLRKAYAVMVPYGRG